MRSRLAAAVAGVVTLAAVCVGGFAHDAFVARAATAQARSCNAAPYRQLDFWLGDWDTFEIRGTNVEARNRVTSLLAGCALQEVYIGLDGFEGRSLSFYDVTRRRWHQTWVTNRGTSLQLDGGLRGDAMILTGPRAEHGRSSLIRVLWRRVAGGVRETATTSANAGRTWQPAFDIMFRLHRSR